MKLSTYCHCLYGLTIESAFLLPGAPLVRPFTSSPDLTIGWQPESAWDPTAWQITMPAGSRTYPDIGMAADGSVCLIWGDALRIAISPRRDRVRLISRAANIEYTPVVVVGFVLGFILFLRGLICLHGAVLERGGKALAVLGEGGAGKSTVAAALVQRGAALLSDDLVVISRTTPRVRVEPGCASVRLDPAAAQRVLDAVGDLPRVPYLDKMSWDLFSCPSTPDVRYRPIPAPLARMYVLQGVSGEGETAIGPVLPPTEALRYLIAAWYPPNHLRLLTQEHMRDLGVLASAVPLQVIRYARSWEQLPKLIEQIRP